MVQNIHAGRAGAFAPRTGTVRSRWSDLVASLNPRPTTLAEARGDPGAAVALEAAGYCILLTCPATQIKCDERALHCLAGQLGALKFEGGFDRTILFDRLLPPAHFTASACPCCGGQYTGELWLHRFFDRFDLKAAVADVLAGRVERLPWSTEELLERATAAEPGEPKWPLRLLALYEARSNESSGEERIAWAARALDHCENAWRADPNAAIPRAATIAFEAGAYATTQRYAERLLRDAWRRIGTSSGWARPLGRQIHEAHVVLGRVALRAGDTAAAERHLLDSALAPLVLEDAETPDFTLAAELTAASELRVLPRYLSLCRFVWKGGRGALDAWRAELDRGGRPAYDLSAWTA